MNRVGTAIAHISTNAHTKHLHTRKASSSAKERQRAEREQLTRLLKESPGKRDARNFLKQFDASKPKKEDGTAGAKAKQAASEKVHNEWGTTRTGVNLGNLYQPSVFTREPLPEQKYEEEDRDEPLHLALVKLRVPQTLSDQTLRGIALTLSQMAQLGLSTAVVLDCDEQTSLKASPQNEAKYENILREQAARFCTVLEEYNEPGALLIEHSLGYAAWEGTKSQVAVTNNFLLYPPLDDGIIPIILPSAYGDELGKIAVDADDVILALTREFSGRTAQTGCDNTGTASAIIGQTLEAVERPLLDRIIVLDPLGGIPSKNRPDGAHVFVNLEAEYCDIYRELQNSHPRSAPIRHLKNLDMVENALSLLPPTSSGLILTPSEAATKAIPDDGRTTPSKNPLLHNLLTDRPMISSSLPTSPQGPRPSSSPTNPSSATFLKKGVPLTMVPDPRAYGPWRPPTALNPSIDLATHTQIDFPKLVDLINDSFRRKLDAEEYLARIRGRVAGIIIAGDYEGGAICTWETPSQLLSCTPLPDSCSGQPSTEVLESTAPPASPHWIPYLDKFAVLTSSQGSGGIADIVWAALTRTCFPAGVVWRSRTSNPVNKWYQERAKGTWNLPGGDWTMFWTTDNVTEAWEERGLKVGVNEGKDEAEERARGMSRWDAYVDVCSKIQPSWSDGIKRVD